MGEFHLLLLGAIEWDVSHVQSTSLSQDRRPNNRNGCRKCIGYDIGRSRTSRMTIAKWCVRIPMTVHPWEIPAARTSGTKNSDGSLFLLHYRSQSRDLGRDLPRRVRSWSTKEKQNYRKQQDAKLSISYLPIFGNKKQGLCLVMNN